MSSLHIIVPHIKTILNRFSLNMLYGLFVKEFIYQSKFKKLLIQKNWNDIKNIKVSCCVKNLACIKICKQHSIKKKRDTGKRQYVRLFHKQELYFNYIKC